jgi:hypothetical protein
VTPAKWLFAILMLATGVVLLAIVRPEAAGWYLVPSTSLFLIGVAMIIEGWRRRRSVLTPLVVGGLMIAWNLGLSPILVAALDHRPAFAWIGSPLRDALAPVGAFHLLGVLLGFGIIHLVWRPTALWGKAVATPIIHEPWQYRRRPFLLVTAVTAAMMLYVIARVGPAEFFSPMMGAQDVTFMAGLGLPLWLGESVFLVIALWLLLAARKRGMRIGLVGLVTICGMFLVAKLAFGGLHGSRSATIWAMLWLLLLFDSIVRPVRRSEWVAIAVGGFLFTYAYGFYKSLGAEAGAALLDQAVRTGLAEDFNRTGEDVVLGDLSRAAVHGLLWERLITRDAAELGNGRTYLAALTLWLPSGLLADPLPSKSVVGSAIENNLTISSARQVPATRQYGISGEAALNFGVIGFIIGPLLYVLAVGILQRRESLSLARGSPQGLLISRLLATLMVSVMLSDLDNWIVLLVRLSPLLAVVWMGVQEPARARSPSPFPRQPMVSRA